MLDYDYDAAMLKKKHLKKKAEAVNQITCMHDIDVTLKLVSAQKDAYASEL